MDTEICLQLSSENCVWWWMCVPEVSLERRAAGIPLGMQEGEGIEECSGLMSQSGKLQECLSRLK